MDVRQPERGGTQTPVEARLRSLFSTSSTPSSSRSSLDALSDKQPYASPAANMRPPRSPTGTVTGLQRTLSNLTGAANTGMNLNVKLPSGSPASSSSATTRTPSPKHHAGTMSESSGYRLPVLKWFGSWNDNDAEEGKSPPELEEALQDEWLASRAPRPHIRTPPKARLPSSTGNASYVSSRSYSKHPPAFFNDLSRATLPTSSVSQPPSLWLPAASSNTRPQSRSGNPMGSPDPNELDDLNTPYIIRDQSPPTRTSLEALRSLTLRDRGMTLPPPESLPSRRSPTSWWFGGGDGSKQAVDSLLDESDRSDTIAHEQSNIQKKYLSPKHPLVFCHGLLGFDSVQLGPSIAPLQVSHWRGIKEVLEANGIEVLITRVPATSSPMERAKVLEETVSAKYAGRSVHLIGHSMGGLDCRYLTTHLTQRKFSILSVTTVGTPHRGSAFADYVLTTLGKERLETVVALLEFLPNGGGDGKAFESLTRGAMRRFNEETPDVEGVRYFSWGAKFEPGLIDKFKWPHSVILEKEGPNDGLVSVESAKWGTYLGTLDDVNHLDLVGWVNAARYKWAEIMGQEIKFKPATFYLGVADHLARVVEGRGRNTDAGGDGDGKGEGDSKEGGKRGEAVRHDGAEGTHAGEGVKTVEGVEHRGPASDDGSGSPVGGASGKSEPDDEGGEPEGQPPSQPPV